MLEFRGRTDLRTSIARIGLLELRGHTGFLVLTGRTILEFVALLELKVCTILLEYTEGIDLRTSTGRTGLLELTGRTSVVKLRGYTGFLVSTGGTILEFTYLLALIVHTIFVSSLTVIKEFIL